MSVTKHEAQTHRKFHFGPCVVLTTPNGATVTITEQWRANGACQEWKRTPERFRLPIKYGLRGYSEITDHDNAEFHTAQSCADHTFAYSVRSLRPAINVVKDTMRAWYKLGNHYRADHPSSLSQRIRHALSDASLLVGPRPVDQDSYVAPCKRHHLYDASCARTTQTNEAQR